MARRLPWLLKLIRPSRSSADIQKRNLALACDIYTRAGAPSIALPVAVPEVLWKSFTFSLEANTADLLDTKEDKSWVALQKKVTPLGTIVKDGFSIREPLRISVQVRNPLSCELVLSQIALQCGWRGDDRTDGFVAEPVAEVRLPAKSTLIVRHEH